MPRSLTPAAEAYVRLRRAADCLESGMREVLRPAGLSPAGYHVLRVLRGAGPGGVPCSRIGRRLLARVPDITRLVDRLERSGFVQRLRSPRDRRVVRVVATEAALETLAALDEPVAREHERRVAALAADEVRHLNALLSRLSRQSMVVAPRPVEPH